MCLYLLYICYFLYEVQFTNFDISFNIMVPKDSDYKYMLNFMLHDLHIFCFINTRDFTFFVMVLKT